ncbi:hypothetical protein FRC04_001168, partial [Tulasnella sp. 424]
MSHRLFDPTALGDVSGNAAAKQYPWGKGLDARHVKWVFGTIQGFDSLLPLPALTPLTAFSPK